MIDWNKWEEYARGDRDMTRRDLMKAGGTAVATTATVTGAVDDDDSWVVSAWNFVTPDRVVISWNAEESAEDYNSEGGDAERTARDNSESVSEPQSESWVDSYDVSSFTEDLEEHGNASIAATQEFFSAAYSDAGNTVNRADIDGNKFVVNNLRSDMYTDEPGLGYSQSFGDTLEDLDENDRLDSIVEGYIETEM